ncbi:MAG: hypothetical protein HQK85_06490 [Nitrospinae bacterium]|nr:hypothetical protein [Nitrospinota bacterium]
MGRDFRFASYVILPGIGGVFAVIGGIATRESPFALLIVAGGIFSLIATCYQGMDKYHDRKKAEEKEVVSKLEREKKDQEMQGLMLNIKALKEDLQINNTRNKEDDFLKQLALQKLLAIDRGFHLLNPLISQHNISAMEQEFESFVRNDLFNIQIIPDSPHGPLFIRLEPNKYRVVFSVPMRIPPTVEISGVPNDIDRRVTDISVFGFTVEFLSKNIIVNNFGFTADAEL